MSAEQRNGSRDLSMVCETGSTARVLNLTAVYHRHNGAEEWAQNPLFRNKRLNTCIILKHSLRPNERAFFQTAPVTATKIIFPFALSDLAVGGSSLFVNQNDYAKILRSAIASNDDALDFERDLGLLQALEGLPSFDPFLMRERLRQTGYDAARCYFEVSEGDLGRMRAFVRNEVGRLVDLAFADGGAGTTEMASKLADMLMTDETAESLEPLRMTLRLSGNEYREGVFAWKGFLYYKWLYGGVKEKIPVIARRIVSARILNATRMDLEMLSEVRQKIVDFLGIAAMHVDKALREYDVAFRRLSDGSPVAFRDFLIRAPGMFIFLGQAIGVIQHIESFWNFRYPQDPARIDAVEAHDVFHEFLASLGGTEAVRDSIRHRA